MGSYDTVAVRCPHCNAILEFQSKAGRCNNHTYGINDVPAAVAESLNGVKEDCPVCGTTVQLNIINHVRIPMEIVEA